MVVSLKLKVSLGSVPVGVGASGSELDTDELHIILTAGDTEKRKQ